MVRARLQMSVKAKPQPPLVAPRHQRIDQPVAAVAGEVGVAKAERAQMRVIGWRAQVEMQELAGGGPRPRRVGFEHHDLLRANPFAGADRRAHRGDRLGRHQRRDRAHRLAHRQFEHPRPNAARIVGGSAAGRGP